MPDQRQTDIKDAGLRSRSVMTWLRDHKLPAEPMCYTVAYEYLFTENTELKSNVDNINFNSEICKDKLEVVYKDNIIAKQYAALSMHGDNVNGYVSEVLSLLLNASSDLGALSKAINNVKPTQSDLNNTTVEDDDIELIEDDGANLCEDNQEFVSQKDNYLELKKSSSKDELTNLLDGKGLMRTLNAALKFKDNYPFAIIRLDIDFFKQFNHANGEKMGDAVLKHIGKAITNQLKVYDIISRFDDDEFLIILPKTPIHGGVAVANILRKKIELISLKKKGALAPVSVKISAGVSAYTGKGRLEEAVQSAKLALNYSKDNGRNCVNIAH